MKKNRLYMMTIFLLRFAFVALLFFGCNAGFNAYKYHVPEKTDDGIDVGSLAEVHIDADKLMGVVARIHDGRYGEVHSMLIYKDRKLVFEEYFSGHEYQWEAPAHHGEWVEWDKDAIHYTHSVSKSITSMCIGIAVDQGYITDVHQSIFDYLPNHQKFNTGEKSKITIEHLLTMTSGLDWAEWNAPLSSMENDQIAIWFSGKGPIDFVLERNLVAEPSSRFNYSGGGIEVLGVILENASGLALDEFSEKYIFEPLGIDTAEWFLRYPSGEFHAAAGLRVRPRDMVKLGVTYLNGGTWNGKRILSAQWVEKSDHPYNNNERIKVPGEDLGRMGYSYTWWTKQIKFRNKTINWFSANGWGGQKIIVMPELNTVVVFTGANYTSKVKEFRIVENYILPAIQ